CFQEFYKEKTNRFNTLDTLLEFQKAIYYHEEYTYINRQTYFFGIITFSRWPIINKGVFHFPGSDNICIFSDMVIHGDTLRIYNCHLESIRFDHKDYAFLDSIELKLDEKRIEGARSIFKRLKYAYIKRAAQADTLAGHIRNCPFPVILCGDFNDTPISYSYHMISRDLEDSFKEAGSGLGVTYAGKFPSFRIDYVLHSKEFEAISMDIISKNYSDHYPVTVELIKRDQ
ncbi:MAG: endonuclease/exonuclease/phosphatase family protein, partial [Bacteroidota bacterium]